MKMSRNTYLNEEKKDDAIILYKVLNNCAEFSNRYKMNLMGIYQIDDDELEKSNFELRGRFFGRIDCQKYLSRSKNYYNSLTLHEIEYLLDYYNSKYEKERNVRMAVEEYLINYLLFYWYKLYFSKDRKIYVEDILQQLETIVENMIFTVRGKDHYKKLDKEKIAYIANRIDLSKNSFRIPEFDHKINIIKEACWILYNEKYKYLDTIVLPMYGAAHLWIILRVFFKMFHRKINIIPLNIGFHDNIYGESIIPTENISDFIRNKKVLILDDNVGSGKTLNACKNIVKRFKGESLTRVAEIPWNIIGKIGNFELIAQILDCPTPKENFRIMSKNIFIKSIVMENYEKVFQSSHIYTNQEREITVMKKRIMALEESHVMSWSKIQEMNRELAFYENV